MRTENLLSEHLGISFCHSLHALYRSAFLVYQLCTVQTTPCICGGQGEMRRCGKRHKHLTHDDGLVTNQSTDVVCRCVEIERVVSKIRTSSGKIIQSPDELEDKK